MVVYVITKCPLNLLNNLVLEVKPEDLFVFFLSGSLFVSPMVAMAVMFYYSM